MNTHISYYYSVYVNLSTSPRDSEGRLCPLIRGTKHQGSIFLGWLLHTLTGADVTVVEEKYVPGDKRSTKTVFHRRMR